MGTPANLLLFVGKTEFCRAMLSKKGVALLLKSCHVVPRMYIGSSARVMSSETPAPPPAKSRSVAEVLQDMKDVDAIPDGYLMTELPQELKDKYYPKIGNRDIVRSSETGQVHYYDMEDFPFPTVRWGANTPEVLALREKEQGDWTAMSIAEKKQLYRASFCQTFAEMDAPTGDWKRILAQTLGGMAITTIIMAWCAKYMYWDTKPDYELCEEGVEAMTVQFLKINFNPVRGVSSMYDFEKGAWK